MTGVDEAKLAAMAGRGDAEAFGALIELHQAMARRVAYAILSFGGFLGVGNKFFAVPLPALSYRPTEDTFVLHVDKETLKRAPGFDKNQWPNMSDRTWGEEIYSHYGYSPYWE